MISSQLADLIFKFGAAVHVTALVKLKTTAPQGHELLRGVGRLPANGVEGFAIESSLLQPHKTEPAIWSAACNKLVFVKRLGCLMDVGQRDGETVASDQQNLFVARRKAAFDRPGETLAKGAALLLLFAVVQVRDSRFLC